MLVSLMEQMKINVTDCKEAIEAINDIINSGGIAEIKVERQGLSVIEIKRKLRVPSKK